MEYFYPAIVKHDAKGGIFSVIFPDLNGCQAQGRTAEEAALKAREALAASLLEMEEKGLEIPPASDERLFVSVMAAAAAAPFWSIWKPTVNTVNIK